MKSLERFMFWIKPRSLTDALLILIFVAMLPFLFYGDFGSSENRVLRMVWNLGHYALFGIFTLLVLARFKITTTKQFLLIVLSVILMGSAVEIVQIFTPRDADFEDVVSNTVGSLIVLFWSRRGDWKIWLGRILSTGYLGIQFVAIMYVGYWQYRIAHQLPLIATFEHRQELNRWEGRNWLSDRYVSEGAYSLKSEFTTRRYSNIALREMPHDWSEYKSLKFDLYNPEKTDLELILRIHDSLHRAHRFDFNDRFNRTLFVRAGWNYFTINLNDVKNAPAGREMEMKSIEEIILFSVGLSHPRQIYTDNWRLE